jgi:hypothetical protein
MYLVSLNPDYFVDTSVSPYSEALAADFHCTPSDPKKEDSFVLERWYRHSTHFIVCHRTIRQLFEIRSDSRKVEWSYKTRTLMCISHGGSAIITWNFPSTE